MSQWYLIHMRIDVHSERHNDVKSMKVNVIWGDQILTVCKKMLHEFERLYRVQNLGLNLFDLFLC